MNRITKILLTILVGSLIIASIGVITASSNQTVGNQVSSSVNSNNNILSSTRDPSAPENTYHWVVNTQNVNNNTKSISLSLYNENGQKLNRSVTTSPYFYNDGKLVGTNQSNYSYDPNNGLIVKPVWNKTVSNHTLYIGAINSYYLDTQDRYISMKELNLTVLNYQNTSSNTTKIVNQTYTAKWTLTDGNLLVKYNNYSFPANVTITIDGVTKTYTLTGNWIFLNLNSRLNHTIIVKEVYYKNTTIKNGITYNNKYVIYSNTFKIQNSTTGYNFNHNNTIPEIVNKAKNNIKSITNSIISPLLNLVNNFKKEAVYYRN